MCRLDPPRLPERIREVNETAARIGADLGRRLDTIGDRFRIEMAGQIHVNAARLRAELILQDRHAHSTTVQLDESSPTGNLQTLEHLPRRSEASTQRIDAKATHLRQQLAEFELARLGVDLRQEPAPAA